MSSTIHALKASARRNSFHSATAPPFFASTAWNSFTPSTSTVAKPAMFSASSSARGRAIRQSSPTSSGTQRMEVSSMASSFEFVQLAHVHRVERLADAEDQNAQHHHRDDHVKENGQLDDQRYPVSRERDGGQHHAVFRREQSEHLRDGFATVDHQEEVGEQKRDGHTQRIAAKPLQRGKGARH